MAAAGRSESAETAAAAPPPSAEGAPLHVVHVAASACPVQAVTVYRDRAEVTRRVSAALRPGANEIRVEELSVNIDRASVHVSGGVGGATILEVSTSEQFGDPSSPTKVAEITKQLEDAGAEVKRIDRDVESFDEKLRWLKGWATGHMNPPAPREGQAGLPSFTDDYLSSVGNFVTFYGEQLAREGELRAAALEAKSGVEERIRNLRRELSEMGGASKQPHVNCSICLSASPPGGEVVLQFAYIIYGASWSPSYDCRVTTGASTLQLSYFGAITNSTSENWCNAQLSLSTAEPSVGGNPPDLPTARVSFRIPEPPAQRLNMRRRAMEPAANAFSAMAPTCQQLPQDSFAMNEESVPVAVLTAQATQGVASSTFLVPRVASIVSDGKEHKVTIAVIDLNTGYTHVCVPKSSPHAYIKATSHNTSVYQLLSGPMNIFIDGNFVSRSSLGNVGVKEEFAMFLGVDGSVKVEYKPSSRVKDETGMIYKSNVERFKRTTVVKNMKSHEIRVLVIDQLPLSNDEKIRVVMEEPDLKRPSAAFASVKLNDQNNVEWRFPLAAQASISIDLQFSVEWPKQPVSEVVFTGM